MLLHIIQFKDFSLSFIADLVLQILSWMSREERDRIRKRQREGIDIALQNGVKFGRPNAEIPAEFEEVYRQWKNQEITAVQAMALLNMKKITFYKLVKECKISKVEEDNREI
ncbi:hypothetical protein [Priestia koreensis]|uniref:hypothetical protein n=1 Tax=Priestia koreensis TaxID=284581 RepID=UPI00334262C3